MTRTFNIRPLATIAAMSLTCLLVLATSTSVFTQSNRSAASQGLEGTWIVQVTLRNCATNASIGSVNSLVTFHAGGTITEDPSGSTFAIGQRSSGHGNWAFDGRRTFSQRMIALINFDTAANLPGTPGFNPSLPVTPGFFAGYSVVTHTLELTDANHATSSGTNEFFRLDGTSYRTGCSSATATRFE